MIGYRYRTLEWEGAGLTNTGNYRDFPFVPGVRLASQNLARTTFDYDNANATKASLENLISSFVTYTGLTKTQLSVSTVNSTQGNITAGGTSYFPSYLKYLLGGSVKGFRYSTDAALSPTTRKIRQVLNTINTNCIALYSPNFVASPSASSNVITGDFTLNTTKYRFLESVYFGACNFGTLTIICNNSRLKYFVLSGVLTTGGISGKLPASLLSLFLTNVTGITSITTLISNCVNLQALFLGTSAGSSAGVLSNAITTLSGTVDLSTKVALKEIAIPLNSSVTNLVLPNHTNWEWVQMLGLGTTAAAAFSTANIDNFFASSGLRILAFTCGITYTKNIGNADISSSLVALFIYNNTLSGTISITTSKPNIKDFRLGNQSLRSGAQQNNYATVDITGLTAAPNIDLTGSNVSDLQLPVNTVCTALNLFDNKLDIVTNSNLLSQITAMTALTALRLGNNSTSISGLNHFGQDSANGIGANPNFSALVNIIALYINKCLATGTLTLPNVNTLTSLNVSFNAGLTSIVNLTSHVAIQNFYAYGCTSLGLTSLSSVFTGLAGIGLSNLPTFLSLDLSGKTTTTALNITISGCSLFTTFTLPTTQARCVVAGMSLASNGLININNMSNINYSNVTTATNPFIANSNALNTTFPFGTNNFIPNNIQIQNNGMSTANGDATIANIFNNANKWDSYTSPKTLTMNGSNASLSGLYQYSATPTTANEMKYYLVITKGWTILSN